MNVAFYKHNIGDAEIASVISVLRSPTHTAGPVTRQFEEEFARSLGCKYAVGVTSGGESITGTPFGWWDEDNNIEAGGAAMVNLVQWAQANWP